MIACRLKRSVRLNIKIKLIMAYLNGIEEKIVVIC